MINNFYYIYYRSFGRNRDINLAGLSSIGGIKDGHSADSRTIFVKIDCQLVIGNLADLCPDAIHLRLLQLELCSEIAIVFCLGDQDEFIFHCVDPVETVLFRTFQLVPNGNNTAFSGIPSLN